MDKDVKGTVSPLSLALLCVGGLATLSNIFKDFKVHLKALLRSRWVEPKLFETWSRS